MQQQLRNIFHWVVRLIAAVIMLQTLYFKFTAAEESVYIFTQMGIEPWGRYATGIAELIAALLILYKPATAVGAFLGLGIMSGAILSHLFVLGIEVQNDGGLLFSYAMIVWVACIILLWLSRYQVLSFISKMLNRRPA